MRNKFPKATAYRLHGSSASVRDSTSSRFADPAQALLLQREIKGLALLTSVRAIGIAVMFLMTLAIAYSGFERIAVTMITLFYATVLVVSGKLIRSKTHLRLVGLVGVGLDSLVVGVLPFIWYQSVGGSEIGPVYTLKTGLPIIAILFIVLNSIAMRPIYPLLVALAAVIVHLGYFIFAIGDERTVVTSNFVDAAMGSHLHGGLFTSTLTVIVGVGILLALVTRSARRLIFEAVNLEKANVQLGRYFSPNLVARLVENPGLLHLGGERRELSFVFTDLAGFTSLVEQQEPHTIVPLLNEYLDAMVNIAFKHEGTVDKIVGDAVHVIFGAPVEQADHAARALACALEMDDFAQAYSLRKRESGMALGETRIGVNTGVVVVGNFGGDSMFDYTAHGDAINTAARLESLNKHLGTRVLVSAEVARQVPDFCGRPAGTFVLKGKSDGLAIIEPKAENCNSLQSTADYLQAYGLLENGDPMAEAAFEVLAQPPGNDPLAAFHLRRIRAGETGTTIVMASK